VPTFTFECHSDAELASLRQAALFLAELHSLAQTAPAGQVLPLAEEHALAAGRRFLRQALQTAAQDRIDGAEAKRGRRAAAPAPVPSASKGGTAAT
jgi:uncharacterized membrane protein